MSHSHNHRPDDEPRHAAGRRGHPRHEAFRHSSFHLDDDFDDYVVEPQQNAKQSADGAPPTIDD